MSESTQSYITDVVLISGPSQVGKSTIQDKLLGFDPLERVITRTTRAPRKNEVDGEDYYFTTQSQFEMMVNFERLIEFNQYAGNLYGTEISEYQRIGKLKRVALQVVDVNGAKAIKRWCNDNNINCVTLFIAPTSIDVILKRLKGFPDLNERYNTAKLELDQAYDFDQVFINDKVKLCVNKILTYLDSKGIMYV